MNGFSIQYKTRQCFQCQGDTEFYCNTCKDDLCLLCKEKHVVDLDTIFHDVVIFREKYEYILKQEPCVRHPGMNFEKYCHSCELPICIQCTLHRKHRIMDIRSAYYTNRQQCKEIIHNIRSEILYRSLFLRASIKTDIKDCLEEISNSCSKMFTNAMRLHFLINTVVRDVLIRHKDLMLQPLIQKMRQMNKQITIIEKYEHRFEQSANRSIKFFSFIKNTYLPNIKKKSDIAQQIMLSLTKEINIENVVKSLCEFQTIERGKREVGNKCGLKLMHTPVLHNSLTVKGISDVDHISCLNSDRVWISDSKNNFILTNNEGDTLHHLTDVKKYSYGVHTLNTRGDLIYGDRDDNISKLSKDNETKSTLIEKAELFIPISVHCSRSNADILVGMIKSDTLSDGKVNRYNNKGQYIQTIQHDSTGQRLYSFPRYITENHNGDVIVSDLGRGVVVTDKTGRHRFTYTGPSKSGPQSLSKLRLHPHGICTDALAHILVCDSNTRTVHMLDKDGQFLSLIPTLEQGVRKPRGLEYDHKAHLLWVGSSDNKEVCIHVYRYIKREDYLTANDDLGITPLLCTDTWRTSRKSDVTMRLKRRYRGLVHRRMLTTFYEESRSVTNDVSISVFHSTVKLNSAGSEHGRAQI